MLHIAVWIVLGVLQTTPPAQPPIVRIAEDVAAANLVRKIDPVYPAAATIARIRGTVTLEVEINAEGAVTSARVLTGNLLLNQSALDAVRLWGYKPEMLKGAPRVATTVKIPFTLQIGRVVCGPLPAVQIYPLPGASVALSTAECGSEVIVSGRTLSFIEVETAAGITGWINASQVSIVQPPVQTPNTPAAVPTTTDTTAALGEARLDCAQRQTLNIFDAPGARTIGRLACGERVPVLALDEPYVRIRTLAGLEGWVLGESLTVQLK